MPKIGLIFPGQGTQFVGMGAELIEAYPAARTIYQRADEVLGFPLSQIILKGPEADLKRTDIAQPAILTAALAAWAALTDQGPGVPVHECMAAGHSLGEYSALTAAGVMNFPEALQLVQRRGALMQTAASQHSGGMAAVIGLSEAELSSLCMQADPEGGVQIANLNCPGQVVVSGSHDGLDKLYALLKARNVRSIPLAVSGPFHSRFMQSAGEQLAGDLKRIPMSPPRFPVLANVSAEPVDAVEDICAALIRQVSGSVRWEDSMRRMLDEGVTLMLEIGPGKVLRGLMKKIAPEVRVLNVFSPLEVEQAVLELSGFKTLH